MRINRTLKSCNEAAAAAELALILPLLLTILFGGFEAGAYLWTEQKVVKAVRDGARFAARQPFSAYSCDDLTDATILAQVQNLTRTGELSGGTPKIAGWDDNNQVTVTVRCLPRVDDEFTSSGVYATQADGSLDVTVAATVNYPSLFGILGFDTTGVVVRASSNAAVMGT